MTSFKIMKGKIKMIYFLRHGSTDWNENLNSEKAFRYISNIFINNDITKLFRQHDSYKGCSECDANLVCRGCPAMKYAVTGDFFGVEPYCWRCNLAEQ